MKTILVIDDSFFTRNIHRQILEKEGYCVFEADGGLAGIEMYVNEKPDFVVTDLMMPDMDGMEVLKKILEIDPAAKIMICSTDRQISRKQDAKEIGVLGFLSKPIVPEQLTDLLKTILD